MQAATAVKVNARTRIQDGSGRKTRKVELTVNMLEPLYHTRQEDAAAILGVSLSSLKSSCRKLGISRWPYSRKRNDEQDTFVSVLLNGEEGCSSVPDRSKESQQDDSSTQSSSSRDTNSAEIQKKQSILPQVKEPERNYTNEPHNIEGFIEGSANGDSQLAHDAIVDLKWIRWFMETGEENDIVDNQTHCFP
eukprot:759523-Hanusia_phi.AAC.1